MLNSSSWLFNSSVFYNGVATQSLRFDSGSSAYLSETLGTPTTRRRWTLSMWIKRTKISYNFSPLFSTGNLICRFNSSDTLQLYDFDGNFDINLITTQVFRDTSAWYNLVFVMDIDGESGNDRLKLYSNGVRVSWSGTDPASYDPRWNYASIHYIGRENTTSNYFDGYMSEVNFVDGTALDPTSFGEFKNGVWIAKEYTGSYGTNGYRLQFNQTGTGSASSSTIGADTSGNDNHWTSSGIVASDCDMPDSPENNWCTLNPLWYPAGTLSEGNLKFIPTVSSDTGTVSTFVPTAKSYWEVYIVSGSASSLYIGIIKTSATGSDYSTSSADWVISYGSGLYRKYGTATTGQATWGASDVMGLAYDADATTLYVYKNNSLISTITGLEDVEHYVLIAGNTTSEVMVANFGQDSTFAGAITAGGNADANGKGDFKYSVPSGYLALCTSNLPEPTISPNANTQADDYFNTVLYIGDGVSSSSGGQAITGVGYQPDMVWTKQRSSTTSHMIHDVVRGAGANKSLATNLSNAEPSNGEAHLMSFDSDGFTVGHEDSGSTNVSSGTYVAWNWKAGGSPVINTAGTITSQVSANTNAGFSIVSYTGNDASSATVGHGLSQAPEMVIVKNRQESITNPAWAIYHSSLGATKYIDLQTGNQSGTATSVWNDTAPTSTVVTIGTADSVNSGSTHIMYCFHSVEGYSKFSSYTGNGSTDGTFVYTGFRPAWVLVKDADASGYNWYLYDNTRDTDNVNSKYLAPNTSGSEINYSGDGIDFLSNGFKLRTLAGGRGTNRSNINYIYMAFAENPFKYSTAR
ncbi:hypothetical protein N9M66_04485 [Litoreibacter sp.]|nr:hypothetical protein [Litoreibacter sp.]MDA8747449.1 hypothetical protein [Litoreibacter sp.]